MNEIEQWKWNALLHRTPSLKDEYDGVRYRNNVFTLRKKFSLMWRDHAEEHVKSEILKRDWSRGFSQYAERLKNGLV
jgi:hypothetical protein